MRGKLRLWGEGRVIKVADDEMQFTAVGIYNLGHNLERLEWAIETIDKLAQIAHHFEQIRICEQVRSFEVIGREAKIYHDGLADYKDEQISEQQRKEMRGARLR